MRLFYPTEGCLGKSRWPHPLHSFILKWVGNHKPRPLDSPTTDLPLATTHPASPSTQCRPFLFQHRTVKPPPCAVVPVVGVPGLALFSVQTGVNRIHPLRKLPSTRSDAILYAPTRSRCCWTASCRMSWFVRRWVARNVQSRTYVLSSTFTVKATGFSLEATLRVAARVFKGVGLCPGLLVAIFQRFLRKRQYTRLRSYVSISLTSPRLPRGGIGIRLC